MNIFRLFENEKFRKICSKTHQIVPFKKNYSEKQASQAPQKVGHLGKSCIRPWTTTEKFT